MKYTYFGKYAKNDRQELSMTEASNHHPQNVQRILHHRAKSRMYRNEVAPALDGFHRMR